MRALLICGVMTAFTTTAHGEQRRTTLNEVIEVAVRESPELELARLDSAAAAGAAESAAGALDVHVGAQASAVKRRDQPTSVVAANRLEILGGQLSISKLFLTGTRVEVAAGSERTTEVAAIDGMERRGFTSSLTLAVNQPLLRGFGPATVLAPIRQAERTRDAAALDREGRARRHIVALEVAYWRVAYARREVDVRKASLELAEKQLAYTEGAIRADKLAKSESLAVQQVIAMRKQDVIGAQQRVLERSLELRELAGLEITPTTIDVDTDPLPDVKPVDLDLAAIVGRAFEHSAELATARARARAAAEGMQAADGAARSRLDLDVAAGPVGTAATLGESLSNATRSAGYAISAMLTFDQAIQRRTERGGQTEARAALQRSRVEERAARAHVATQASRAVQRANAASAVIALAQAAVSLGEQNVVAEQRKLELGKSNNFEVLRRQDELEQANLRLAAAIVDYLSARSEIDGLTGEVLARYRITMR